jgi:hypothetical protein
MEIRSPVGKCRREPRTMSGPTGDGRHISMGVANIGKDAGGGMSTTWKETEGVKVIKTIFLYWLIQFNGSVRILNGSLHLVFCIR